MSNRTSKIWDHAKGRFVDFDRHDAPPKGEQIGDKPKPEPIASTGIPSGGVPLSEST